MPPFDALLQYGRPSVAWYNDPNAQITGSTKPYVLPEDQMNQSGGAYVQENANSPQNISSTAPDTTSVVDKLKALQEQNDALVKQDKTSPSPDNTPPSEGFYGGRQHITIGGAQPSGTPTQPPTGDVTGTPTGTETITTPDMEQIKALQQQNDALISQDNTLPGTGEGKGTINDFLSGAHSVIINALGGANQKLAEAMGHGLAALDYITRTDVGAVQGEQATTPQEYTQKITDLMHQVGIAAGTNDTIANKVGQETVKALPELGALYVAAPALAAKEGVSVVSYLSREVGKFVQEHPGLLLLQQVGADTGALTAQKVTGSEGPVTTMAGSMVGGMLAGGVAGIVRRTGNLALKAGEGIANMVTGGKPSSVSIEPIKPYAAEPEMARQYAAQAVEGAQMRMQKAINDAVESVPTVGTPEQSQVATRDALNKAERISNGIVEQFWKRVPLKSPVPMSGIRSDVNEMEAEIAGRPSAMPKDFMDRLKELSNPIRDPETGKMVKSLPTIERLRDFRGEIRRARVAEQALPNTNDGLVRNYNRLEGIIDDGIQRAYPNDVSIDQARKASIEYHNFFSRSDLAKVLATNNRGGNVVPPEQTTQALMKTYGGVKSLTAMQRATLYKRAPGGKGFAINSEERQQLQDLTAQAEQSLRDMFREVAANKGPQAAAQFVGKNSKTISALSKVYGELSQAANKITSTMEEQVTLQKSAIAKYASTDPRVSANAIWRSANPLAQAKEVLLTLRNDPEALRGFQGSILDKLFEQSNNDAIRLRNIINDPKYRNMLEATLGTDGKQRLDKIINTAAVLTDVKNHSLRTRLANKMTIAARIISLHFFKMLPFGHTLQAQSIVSGATKSYMDNVLRNLNTFNLLKEAIINPHAEQLLLSRYPTNIKEVRALTTRMRKFVAIGEATRLYTQNKLGEQNDQKATSR